MLSEQVYIDMLNHIEDGAYVVDTQRRILFWNKGAEAITGYTQAEMVGVRCQDTLLDHVDTQGCRLCKHGCPLYASLVDGTDRTAGVFARHKAGHRVPVSVKVYPIYEGETVTGCIEIFKQSEPVLNDETIFQDLVNKASYDTLTKLPNRSNLQSFLKYRIKEVNRSDRIYCVLLLDIDNFGHFNNTYGHDVGDVVLISLGEVVSAATRGSDIFGRWGGEEFIGIFELKDISEAPLLAEKIRALIENNHIKAEPHQDLQVTASIGITIIRENDTESDIIKRADELMYESKNSGKNKVSFGQ